MTNKFMRLETFKARLDEFSFLTDQKHMQIQRIIKAEFGVNSWDDIPEMNLGAAFERFKHLAGAK